MSFDMPKHFSGHACTHNQQSVQNARTTIRSGLRARYISDGDRVLIEPRLSVGHALADGVRIKVGGGLYNQYLQLIASEGFSAADVYVPIDKTTRPGRAWQAVLGTDWEASRAWHFSAETYYTVLSNLVDFDAQYGHRNDIAGYAANLERFDARLGALLPRLRGGDLLVVTADHGNDPTTPSTDHAREYVPLLVTGPHVRAGYDLGTRMTFADLGQTLAEVFGVGLMAHGSSFLRDIIGAP